MKKLLSAATVAATLATLGVAAPASAELSATAGLVSEYYFRGIALGDAGAYVSAEYGAAGFYAGTWIIDDSTGAEDGLETDFYLGYGMEHGENFSWKATYNRYDYTYTSDYEDELALSLGLPVGFGLDLVKGQAHDETSDPTSDADYLYYAASWGGEVFGVLLGHGEVDEDTDESSYNHAEVSAGGEVSGVDVGVTAGVTFGAKDAAGDDTSSGDGYIVFDISKTFSL